jgi:hypothetical protein
MIYTAVFQDSRGHFGLETHVSTHDRPAAWQEIYEKRKNKESCLVLLIDGQASVRTFDDAIDIPA